MPPLPDWMAADEFVTHLQIPPALANRMEGWMVELRPLSLTDQIALIESKPADGPQRLTGPECVDRMLHAIISPDMVTTERDEIDLATLRPDLHRWLTVQCLQLAIAGQAPLGEGWMLQPAPGPRGSTD